jgi:hypothetical protein
MTVAREQHTSTLLQDATVLIVGGARDSYSNIEKSAELFE